MAKKDDTKIRVIAVYRMLSEGKLLTSTDIIRRLSNQYGITADRKTIYDDIRAVDRFIPIEVIPGSNGGYKKMEV